MTDTTKKRGRPRSTEGKQFWMRLPVEMREKWELQAQKEGNLPLSTWIKMICNKSCD